MINQDIVYSENLSAYEKIILLLLSYESGKELSSEFFMKKLDCSKEVLEYSFNRLVNLGYLELEMENTSIKKNGFSYKKVQYKEFDSEKYENDLEHLRSIIQEPINDRQARIILNMAKKDFDLIKNAYKKAINSQYTDKIGVLIKEIQKSKKIPAKKRKNNSSQINYESLSKLKK